MVSGSCEGCSYLGRQPPETGQWWRERLYLTSYLLYINDVSVRAGRMSCPIKELVQSLFVSQSHGRRSSTGRWYPSQTDFPYGVIKRGTVYCQPPREHFLFPVSLIPPKALKVEISSCLPYCLLCCHPDCPVFIAMISQVLCSCAGSNQVRRFTRTKLPQ